ncbi:hypothetical protein J437_LFUL006826 [Ladona fulva]|uniref:Carboxylesterase type B domain-containing protein n=1 Tax=Ladona fulva TaxID=123851 RepID=A0A8K0K0P2_LADFU|nr:hypothetical protein J437_LFUL006826 [Ladona fulva]
MKELNEEIVGIYHEKREEDGCETPDEEPKKVKGLMGKGSFESLRQAIAAGIKHQHKKSWRERLSSSFSRNGLIIVKVSVFLFLLTATAIITILSVKESQTKMEENNAFEDFLPVNGNTVIAYTSCGPVQGWVEDGGFAFRGIPYALPPVEELRWKPPVPLQRLEYCWNETLITKRKGSSPNSCWQTYRNGSLDGSEDCLTVDVFTPRSKRNGQRPPVVVLISAETLGGGGGKGFISPQLLSPKLAKAAGIVFVRVRFRLGVLGFFRATALSKSVHPPHSGNYGLTDVHTALQWVNLNAASFGADPHSITVLGHRAGATLVLSLMASKRASNLFSRVWLSGPAVAFPSAEEDDLLDAERQGDMLVESLECTENFLGNNQNINSATCMQEVDSEDLLDTVPEDWKWRPVDLPVRDENSSLLHNWLTIDGEFLTEDPLASWHRHGLHIPLVIGTTSHGEATPELRQRNDWTDLKIVEDHINQSVVGEMGLTEEALKLYSANQQLHLLWNESLQSVMPLVHITSMITDIRSICPLIDFARSASRFARKVPIYLYIMASQPEEAGAIGATVEAEDKPDLASAVVGPGADLLEILTHPLESHNQSSSIGRMFYTYVMHGPSSPNLKKSYTEWDSMEKVGSWPDSKMPRWVTLVKSDGRVEPVSNYPN